MGSVKISDVRKSYGALEVLHGVSVDIADGEFTVLVGPSGCGKSTLLRMIAGLEAISGGEIAIDGKVVNNVAPKERDIAMVFQSYALYPHMTVEANMGFSLRLAGAPKPEIAKRVADAAKMLSLEPYLQRYPRHLSGGQRQRVAMGRAMVRNPKVFLFDEPLSNLDAKLRVQMRSEIKQNHQRLKTTTVYVTHDQIEAMTMADRIVVMHGGIVEQIGSPLELYDHPANLFVAGFIGSPAMNVLKGRLDKGSFITPDGTRIAVTGANALGDRPITLGVRPEHLRIDPEGLAGEIITVDPMGSETQVAMRLGGHDLIGVFRERISNAPGESLRISVDTDHVHLFDTETGKRLAR
ncbi:MAG: sn-glycerol-3-phosphate ABC transporter ATP-binding protein UgpC [Rhizobiaceae bacterium]|nr:sn-glycerol-3-phosphate ABC transporter ATP-binding protein UgpC [Rhizobiaceae bacterium]